MNAKQNKHIDLDPRIQEDSEKLLDFVHMYCSGNHKGLSKTTFVFNYPKVPLQLEEGRELCDECAKLLKHAIVMRYLCPLDPKPKCRNCPEHCYKPEYRDAMDVVMRYVGPRLMLKRR